MHGTNARPRPFPERDSEVAMDRLEIAGASGPAAAHASVLADDQPIVAVGHNCWRIERATRAAVVVDAADYFHFAREAMERARQRILVIGWDFDSRVDLEPESDGEDQSLGEFFLRLAHRNPERRIDILKWSFGAKKQFLHVKTVWTLLRWWQTRAIDFRFDSAHPPGCSHHQKILVIDDHLAACGGIDMSLCRWDTPDHVDEDERRVLPSGKPYGPWHDATMMMEGPVAVALAQLGATRWEHATGEVLPPISGGPCDLWPDDLETAFQDVDIAISRTVAQYGETEPVHEIEALHLDIIAAARKFLYIENQYLTSGKIAAAISKRMEEPDPPEIVLVMPRTADGWLEQKAMDGARVQLARMVGKIDRLDRFRIYVPVSAQGADIYVHAKVTIADDRLLRVGSSNLNNRSLGLDSECDVTIDAALPANRDCRPAIRALRDRLLAEHLGVTAEEFAATFADTGSLIAAIERLTGSARRLELLDLEKPGPLDAFIAENELLDPTRPDAFLEPLSQRGLWKTWRKGLRWPRHHPRARRAHA